MRAEIIGKVKLAIQVQEGVTKKGKPGRRTFHVPKIRHGVTQEEVKTVVAALEKILAYPVIGIRLIEEKKQPVWWPELRALIEAKENAAVSRMTGFSQVRRGTQAYVGATSAHVGTAPRSSSSLPVIPRILAEPASYRKLFELPGSLERAKPISRSPVQDNRFAVSLDDLHKLPQATAYIGYEPPVSHFMPLIYGEAVQGV